MDERKSADPWTSILASLAVLPMKNVDENVPCANSKLEEFNVLLVCGDGESMKNAT